MNAGQKSGSASSLTSGSKIGDLVRAGVGRDGLDSPGHDKSSGVSSYNSEAGGVKSTMIDQAQMNQLLTRLAKIEEENHRLRSENDRFKNTLEDTNVTLKDEFCRFEKEIKGLKQTIIRQNDQIISLAARVGAQEANRALSSMELEPPSEKDIETINDVAELEKMLEYENDYENRKRIRAQLRLLNKKKNDEREQQAKAAVEPKRNSISPKGIKEHSLTINSTDDDEIKVEKRSRQRSRLQRSQTIATSTSTQNVLSTSDGKIKPLQSRFNTSLTNINRNEELREHRSESLISLNESEFASASPSPDNKAPPATPSSAVPQTPTSVPQTPTLISSNPLTKTNSISTSSLNTITTSSSTTTARTGVQQQQRPQTARQPSPEPKVEKVERPSTARAKAEDDSSVYQKSKSKASYTQSGRSYTMSALDQKTTDKTKETTINDLKKRAELRKNDNFIKRVNSMPNGGHAATQSAREKLLAKIGEDPTKKVKLTRSNTFSSGGATGVKALLLKWCQARLRTYSVDVTNYSSSWADGSAFCGLVHSFFPDEFDWSAVHENAETEEKRRHNFNLAFDTALKRADAEPLIEVDDMIFMGNRPDAKCIFCYLQSLYNKLKKFEKLQKAEAEAEV